MTVDFGSSPATYFQLFEKIFLLKPQHNITGPVNVLFHVRRTRGRARAQRCVRQGCSTWSSSPSPVQAGARRASRRPRVCPGAAESASGSTCGWASASSRWAAGTELLCSRRSTSSSTRWDAGRLFFAPAPSWPGEAVSLFFFFSFGIIWTWLVLVRHWLVWLVINISTRVFYSFMLNVLIEEINWLSNNNTAWRHRNVKPPYLYSENIDHIQMKTINIQQYNREIKLLKPVCTNIFY